MASIRSHASAIEKHGVVTRVQRGLHAVGYGGGVHCAFLESRIGHFERMVSRALTGERFSVARPGMHTQADLTAEAGRPSMSVAAAAAR